MDFIYETERLVLRLLHESSAPDVLQFYLKNRSILEAVEPERPQNFYTLEYQSTLLRCEFQLAVKKAALRFWVFQKNQPGQIVGTISFQNILRTVYQSCQIGYKFDSDYWHRGFAAESVQKAAKVVFQEFELHRMEALVLPDNQPSIRLLERIGFQLEGKRRSCICLPSGWTDHLQYSLIHEPDCF